MRLFGTEIWNKIWCELTVVEHLCQIHISHKTKKQKQSEVVWFFLSATNLKNKRLDGGQQDLQYHLSHFQQDVPCMQSKYDLNLNLVEFVTLNKTNLCDNYTIILTLVGMCMSWITDQSLPAALWGTSAIMLPGRFSVLDARCYTAKHRHNVSQGINFSLLKMDEYHQSSEQILSARNVRWFKQDRESNKKTALLKIKNTKHNTDHMTAAFSTFSFCGFAVTTMTNHMRDQKKTKSICYLSPETFRNKWGNKKSETNKRVVILTQELLASTRRFKVLSIHLFIYTGPDHPE